MRFIKYFIIFALGALFSFLAWNFYYQDDSKTSEASYTIAYGIKRLNKLVVAEQQFANYYNYENSSYVLSKRFLSFDKKVNLLVKVNAQASYDLSQMKVEIDSVNEVIHIKSIPDLKVEYHTDTEFIDLDQSKMNQFTKQELNGIKSRGIKAVRDQMDISKLEEDAEEQLIENLEEIYLLAKIYGWRVENDSPYADRLEHNIQL